MLTRRRLFKKVIPLGMLVHAVPWRLRSTAIEGEEIIQPTSPIQTTLENCCVGWFRFRDRPSAELASLEASGSVVYLEGHAYKVDPSATGVYSVTNDLGVDGLVPFGVAHPLQFGDLRRKSAIDLVSGDVIRGDGKRATLITNESPTAAISYLGGTGSRKHFGIELSDLQVITDDYSLGNGFGIETANQGYAFLSNTEVFGGLKAAFKAQANVGQTTLNCHFGRSKVAERLDNPSSILGNTAFRHFGLLRRVVEVGVQNTGSMRGLKNLLGVWENFNKLNEQTDEESIKGFLSLGEWFEAYGHSRVDYSSGELVLGEHDGVLVTEKMNMPLFWGSYFSAPERFEGSFYPRIVGAHITPKTSIGVMKFDKQDSDGQFDFDATVTNWGKLRSYGIESTLPKLGDWSDPDEKYYRQGVFNSIGVANHAGIWDGASGPCKNEFAVAIDVSSYNPEGSWPYTSSVGGDISVIPKQADPYGGDSGVLVRNGLKTCTNLESFVDGGKWITVAVIGSALEPGDVLYMYLHSVGGKPWSKTVKLEMPDSQWRIYHTHTFLPDNPGANFRVGIGADGGGVTIGRAACFLGADLHPVINYGQEIKTGFRLVHGQVEVMAPTVPVSGRWYVGDRVRFTSPVAGGKLGAVCVAEGMPGDWRGFGSIDI